MSVDLELQYLAACASGCPDHWLVDRNFGATLTLPQNIGQLDRQQELARVTLKEAWQARAWEVAWSIESPLVRVDVGSGTPVLIPAQTTVASTRVRVRWGTGGAYHVVELDAWPGGSLSVTAQQVELSVIPSIANAQAPAGLALPNQFSVSGTIAPAPGKRRSIVYRTSPLGDIAEDASVDVAVPTFGRRATIHTPATVTTTGDAWFLDFLLADATGPPASLARHRYGNFNNTLLFGQFVPIPQIANVARVTSGLVGDNDGTLIWELEI